VLALALAGCTGQPPDEVVTGVVIAVDGPTVAQVDRVTIRTANGTTVVLTVGPLDLAGGGLPAAHLRAHLVSGIPITAHVRNGVMYYYIDAVSTPGPTATSQATGQPTQQPTATSPPTPTAQPTHALQFTLDVEPFADGFGALTFVTNAHDGGGSLYAVEQRGVIWRIAADGTVDQTPFLDITDRIACCDERGLLGLAFHPSFAQNGRFFVDYTDLDGNTVVAEFGLAPDGFGDPGSERFLLGVEQPFANHNGGMLAFGFDGYLYIGTGDGGSGGDPLGNGQNLDTLLGKILRIDINSGDPYAIPDGNPFAGGASALPEIWDYGMRNPWRFSFDRQTGVLWIGDVGQNAYEEVDAEPPGAGGRNYGWNVMEAKHCYGPATCQQDGITLPVAEYSHDDGCSITGGYVYRGQAYPALVGQYVFSDYCSGNLWAINAADTLAQGSADITRYGVAQISPTGFGEDEAGELYLVNGSGQIFRLSAG
jgi:glucose/arabinose dehydrogenase